MSYFKFLFYFIEVVLNNNYTNKNNNANKNIAYINYF